MTAPTVRRAVPQDAAELARLRSLMYEAMGADVSVPGWLRVCEEHFSTRIGADPGTFAAFVVDGVEPGMLAAAGCGWIEHHLPGPRNPSGFRGHLANMSTDPAARRQGFARLILGALLDWFVEVDVAWVDLHATTSGEPLYRSAGFGEPNSRALTWVNPHR